MYSPPLAGLPDEFFIHTVSAQVFGDLVVGTGSFALASGVWQGAASRAFFYPFTIIERHTYVRACVDNGAAVSGNFDLGVYSLAGARLFSTGAQAHATINVMQKVTINWTLDPGTYYLALVFDNVTAAVMAAGGAAGPTAACLRSAGAKQMTASAYPLPASATFAALASSFVPVFGISEVSWI